MNPYELIGRSLGTIVLVIVGGAALWVGFYITLKWAQMKMEKVRR